MIDNIFHRKNRFKSTEEILRSLPCKTIADIAVYCAEDCCLSDVFSTKCIELTKRWIKNSNEEGLIEKLKESCYEAVDIVNITSSFCSARSSARVVISSCKDIAVSHCVDAANFAAKFFYFKNNMSERIKRQKECEYSRIILSLDYKFIKKPVFDIDQRSLDFNNVEDINVFFDMLEENNIQILSSSGSVCKLNLPLSKMVGTRDDIIKNVSSNKAIKLFLKYIC